MKQLKLKEASGARKEFDVEIPERLLDLVAGETRISFVYKFNEWQYSPRTNTSFLHKTILTIDELEAIIRKLKELNKS